MNTKQITARRQAWNLLLDHIDQGQEIIPEENYRDQRYVLASGRYGDSETPCFLFPAETVQDAARHASVELQTQQPSVAICIYDLDTLVGQAPRMTDAKYEGEWWTVFEIKDDDQIRLRRSNPDKRSRFYIWADTTDDQLEDRSFTEEERYPAHYKVADTITLIVFNSTLTEV